MDNPHPLETLGDSGAYGPEGSISRYHNPDHYTRVRYLMLCRYMSGRLHDQQHRASALGLRLTHCVASGTDSRDALGQASAFMPDDIRPGGWQQFLSDLLGWHLRRRWLVLCGPNPGGAASAATWAPAMASARGLAPTSRPLRTGRPAQQRRWPREAIRNRCQARPRLPAVTGASARTTRCPTSSRCSAAAVCAATSRGTAPRRCSSSARMRLHSVACTVWQNVCHPAARSVLLSRESAVHIREDWDRTEQ